jgi:hypothetical protein
MADKRTDVLRKVQALNKTAAAGSGATDDERISARDMAIKLRLRHGISDDDLALEGAHSFDFFGQDLFWFPKHIKGHVSRIRDEIAAALEKLDAIESLQIRAVETVRFYKELRTEVEGEAWMDRAVKVHRDAAVKAFYEAEFAEYKASRANADDDHEENVLWYRIFYHQHARDRVAVMTDLRKETVESIVGLKEKALRERMYRERAAREAAADASV